MFHNSGSNSKTCFLRRFPYIVQCKLAAIICQVNGKYSDTCHLEVELDSLTILFTSCLTETDDLNQCLRPFYLSMVTQLQLS